MPDTLTTIYEGQQATTGTSGSGGGSSEGLDQSTADARYLRQSLNGSDIDSASDFRANIKTYSLKKYGGDDSGAADSSTAWSDMLDAVPDGGTVFIDEDSLFRIDTGKKISNKSVNVVFENGAKLIQDADTTLLEVEGEYSPVFDVTSIDTITQGFPDAPDSRVTRLTVSSDPSAVGEGDIIRVVSDDRIPRTQLLGDGRGQYMGHSMMVAEVDSVNDYIYLSNVLPNDTLFSTNVRCAVLQPYTCRLINPTVEVNGSAFTSPAIILRNLLRPTVTGFECRFATHRPLIVAGCFGYNVEIDNVSNVETEAGSRQGYAFFDMGSTGVCHLKYASNLRHGYSNDANYINTDDSDIGKYGWSHDSVIYTGTVKGSTDAGLDTHTAAYNTIFIGGNIIDSFSGYQSSTAASFGNGIQARGYLTKFIGVSVRGGRVPLGVAPIASSNNNDAIKLPVCILEGCELEGAMGVPLIRLRGDVGFQDQPSVILKNTTVIDRSNSTDVFRIEGNMSMSFDNLSILVKEGSRSDFKSFFVTTGSSTSANITGKDLKIYTKDFSITTQRIVRIDNAWTGKIDINGVEIDNNSEFSRIVLANDAGITGDFSCTNINITGNLNTTISENEDRFTSYKVGFKASNISSNRISKTISADDDLDELVGRVNDIIYIGINPDAEHSITDIPAGVYSGQTILLSNTGSNDLTVLNSGSNIDFVEDRTIPADHALTAFWNGSAWVSNVDGIFARDIEVGRDATITRDLNVGGNTFIAGGLFAKEFVVDVTRNQSSVRMSPTAGGKIATITDATVGAEKVTFEDEDGNAITPFSDNDLFQIKVATGASSGTIVKSIKRKVVADGQSGNVVSLTTSGATTGTDVGTIEVGDDATHAGNTTNAGRDHYIDFITAGVTIPYIGVKDEVDDFGGGFEAVRFGGVNSFDASITGDAGIMGATSADGAVFWITEDEARISRFTFDDINLFAIYDTNVEARMGQVFEPGVDGFGFGVKQTGDWDTGNQAKIFTRTDNGAYGFVARNTSGDITAQFGSSNFISGLDIDGTLTMGASGEITNSGGDYVIDADGITFAPPSSWLASDASVLTWEGTSSDSTIGAYGQTNPVLRFQANTIEMYDADNSVVFQQRMLDATNAILELRYDAMLIDSSEMPQSRTAAEFADRLYLVDQTDYWEIRIRK